ncbi:MAG: SpoIIE family protein phosphatase [Myxococcales bacterium]|nr:SpoIIE family protein phosphatase [Myxococcales bacterium]
MPLPPAEGRAPIPLGLKLSLVAVGLVAVVTVAFTTLGHRVVEGLYDTQAERLRESRVRALELRSLSVAEYLGETAREALAGAETGRLYRLLLAVAGHDREIHHATLTDELGRPIARSDEPPELTLARAERLSVASSGVVADEVVVDGQRLRRVTYAIRDDASAGGRTLGFLQIAWSMNELNRDLAAIVEERDRQMGRATEILFVVGGLAVAFGAVVAAAASTAITRPLQRLASTARALSAGDLGARSPGLGRDELGQLAETVNVMADHIEALLAEARRHAEVERELALAREIQRTMSPGSEPVRATGVELVGVVEPTFDCGGDFWTWAPLTRSRTLILVGDVTGHGLSSAMLTATARSCIDTIKLLTQGEVRVGHLLRMLDQLLRESIGHGYFMTCFAAIVDPIEKTLTYSNAGHPPPLLFRVSSDGWREGRLTSRGNRLGDADGYAFVEHKLSTASGDLVCFYTDGLTEAEDPRERPMGARRLRAAISAVADAPPKEVVAAIFGALKRHTAGAPLRDDVSVVVARLSG